MFEVLSGPFNQLFAEYRSIAFIRRGGNAVERVVEKRFRFAPSTPRYYPPEADHSGTARLGSVFFYFA